MDTIRCPHCGKMLPDFAVFCRRCGSSLFVFANQPAPARAAAVASVPPTLVTAPAKPSQTVKPAPPPPKPAAKSAGGGGFIVMIIIFAAIAWHRSQSTKPVRPTPQQQYKYLVPSLNPTPYTPSPFNTGKNSSTGLPPSSSSGSQAHRLLNERTQPPRTQTPLVNPPTPQTFNLPLELPDGTRIITPVRPPTTPKPWEPKSRVFNDTSTNNSTTPAKK